MNILFIVSAPITKTGSANIQNISYIKGLEELGHSITIVCAASEDLYNYEMLKRLGIENITICPIPYSVPAIMQNKSSQNSLKSKIKRIIKDLYHKFSIFDHYKILTKRITEINLDNKYYDIIISASDPRSAHLIADRIIKMKLVSYGKWIQLYGDPIFMDINNNYVLPGWYIKFIERKLIKKADKVLYVSILTLKEQQNIFSKYKDKMYVVPPAYPQEKIYKEKPLGKKLKLGYLGDYISSLRNILPLYNAICESTNVELIITGNSDLSLQEQSNIQIKKRVHFSEVEKLENEVDILVGICNSKGSQIPAKLYYYSGTNKPVIFIIDGTPKYKALLKQYIEGFNRFIVCDNTEADIKNTLNNIETLITLTKNEPLEEFSRKNVIEKLISIMQ